MATADTYPHIVLANDGKAVIEGTRYTVEHIAAEQYFYGWSAEEILRQHPDLRPAEVYAALAFFHDHRDSIVVRNKGVRGVDGRSVEEVLGSARSLLARLQRALLDGTYQPGDIRRVWIPKPGGGERGLGIPNVIDRWVQQAVLQVLEPVFELTFHSSSHGFRPKRGAHTAIAEAKEYVGEGYGVVVDIDLSKFFDRVHHQRLLSRLGQKVADPRPGWVSWDGFPCGGLIRPLQVGRAVARFSAVSIPGEMARRHPQDHRLPHPKQLLSAAPNRPRNHFQKSTRASVCKGRIGTQGATEANSRNAVFAVVA